LHISANDVLILDASFQGLLSRLQALNATLQQGIKALDQKIADLQNNTC
jgi:hypothetical protein